jgi:hypothetical protein
MDGVAVIRALLLEHEPLVALVGDRIMAGTVPAGVSLPAVGITEVGSNDLDTVARKAAALVTARIQVTVYANNYPQMKAALKAAGLGRGVFTGTIAGVKVLSVLRDTVGPDMSDEAPGLAEQSRDFKVTYVEPD